MSVPKILFAEFGQGRSDNFVFSLAAAGTMTCYFKESGVNTGTAKYYDLKYPAKRVLIINNAVASITHINGRELNSPLTLGTGTPNTFRRGIEWNSITIRADSATNFEVYAS